MALLRIVCPDHIVEQLHREALRDNRSDSAMGLILLREGLEQRRSGLRRKSPKFRRLTAVPARQIGSVGVISLKLLSALNNTLTGTEIDELADLLRDGTIEPCRVNGDLIESLALTSEGRAMLPPRLPRLPTATA